jgi:hypothetical protein
MLVNVPVIWGIVALCALGVFVGGLLPQWTRQRQASLALGNTTGKTPIGFSAAALFVLAVMLALFISQGSITNMLATSLDVSHVEVRPSWETTVAIAHQVYNANPIFGSGPGTFVQDWSLYRPRELNNTIFWNSDFDTGIGFIPTSFITTGAVGAIAWIVFLALFLMTGFRTLVIRSKEDEIVSFLSLSSFLGALYLWTIAIFQTPTPVLLSLAFLVTGISVASLMFRSNAPRRFSVVFTDNPNFGFIAALLLTLCFLGGWAAVVGAPAAVDPDDVWLWVVEGDAVVAASVVEASWAEAQAARAAKAWAARAAARQQFNSAVFQHMARAQTRIGEMS